MMITRKAESDTLPTWMQTGKSPDQTWWKESSGCNTNFKSSVMIRDGYEGVNRELKKTVVDGETEYMFPKVLTGDVLTLMSKLYPMAKVSPINAKLGWLH